MPGIRPYFALKCNAALPVLATLAERGAGFEIASVYELEPLAGGRRASPRRPVQQHRETRAAHPDARAREGCGDSRSTPRASSASSPRPLPARPCTCASMSRTRTACFPLSRKFGTSADEALRLLTHGARARSPPLRSDLPRRLAVHGPVDVLPGHRAMRPRDATARAVRDPHRDAQHRRRHAGDLRRPGARHPGGRRRRRSRAIARLPYRPPQLVAEPGRFLVAESSVLVATVIGIARPARRAVGLPRRRWASTV